MQFPSRVRFQSGPQQPSLPRLLVLVLLLALLAAPIALAVTPESGADTASALDLRKDGDDDAQEGGGAGLLKLDEDTLYVSESAGVALIKVERSKGENGTVTVTFSASPGTAQSPADFTAITTTLTWSNNDGSDRWIEIPIVDDGESEGQETILLALTGPTGGAVVDVERGSATLIVTDGAGTGGDGVPCDDPPGDDSPCDGTGDDNGGDGNDDDGNDDDGDDNGNDDNGDDNGDDDNGDDDDDNGNDDNGDGNGVGKAGLFKFDQRTFVAREGQGFAVITVERSKGETGAVEVTFLTRGTTATGGVDYEDVIATLSWPPGGGGVRSINVPLFDDSETEGAETVELLLTDPTGGAGLDPERSTAVLTLIDDEAASGDDSTGRRGVLKFDESSFEVLESAGIAVITVERSKGESGRVTVGYRTSDGSAEDGIDYAGTEGVLSWTSGDGSARTIEIPIFDDSADEGAETVQLELFDPTGGATLDAERSFSLLEILDDDGSTSSCSSSDTTLCLQSGRFAVEVVWRLPDGRSGQGKVNKLSERSGLFWFFRDDNFEMLFKTVDGCAAGLGAHWMYYAATTNVDFTVTVTDTRTGVAKQYRNLMGNEASPVQDTRTFSACAP